MQMYVTASSIREKVEKIASKVADIKTDLFVPVTYKELGEEKTSWIYPYPLRAYEEIEINEVKYTTGNKMTIVNLNLPEQAYMYELVSDKLGFKVTFPSLALNLEAYYNPATRLYKDNFLYYFWVYNGILARYEGKGKADVRRVVGAKFVDEPAVRQILQDKEGREFPFKSTGETVVIKYILDPAVDKPPLQAELPTKLGKYFDGFDNVAPTNKDLKNEGKGCWYATRWENDLSVVWSSWDRHDGCLKTGADGPFYSRLGAMALATDENPKK